MSPSTHPENLEGWIPSLATPEEVRVALEKAFDYRGDVTLTFLDGSKLEGYVFDRRVGDTLEDSCVRLLPKDTAERVVVFFDQIAALTFTGRDNAAGKSFDTWIRKYNEKKAAGEKNIGLEPEKLD